jgi:Uncharacterized conserved protein (DUF2190)
MANLTITAANVIRSSTSKFSNGTAGAAVTAGQVVYLDSADGRYKLADANSATAAVRAPIGIALNDAATGQPLTVATEGAIVLGATITAGVAYYLSATPGAIAPVADLTTGDYPCILGIAKSATDLDINITCADVALA